MKNKKVRIVILDAGFGGTYCFKKLHTYFHKKEDIEVILVNRTNYFLFTPLLHEVATGGVLPHHIVEPLRKVLGCCLADFHLAEVAKVYLKKQYVQTSKGNIPYNYLVLALGAQTDFYDIPGTKEYAFTLKSLQDAQSLKNHFIQIFERVEKEKSDNEQTKLLRFAIVGGGPTGVEMAAEMSEFFYETMKKHHEKSSILSKIHIILIQRPKELLPQFSPPLRKISLEVITKKHIDVLLEKEVIRLGKDFIELNGNEIIPCRTIIWAAGVTPSKIPFDQAPSQDSKRKILVNEFLQIPPYKNVFAIGDIANVKDKKTQKPLPTLAQVAVKEGEAVADNIKLILTNKPLTPFQYKHQGYLISLGQWLAIGEIKNIVLEGPWVWWLYRIVYLSKLLSWQKKIKVALDWTLNIFSPRDISQV